MKKVLTFTIFFLLFIVLTVSANEERVAIITVYDDIDDVSSIQTYIDEIKDLNYTGVAIHSRYRGDATYLPNKSDSSYPNNEPRSYTAGSVDVLQEFTQRGHASGLEVFAYVNCYLVTDGKDSDWRDNHILNTHPDWVTYYYNNGSPIVQTTEHNGDGKWIDPGIPQARQYIADLCGDIMMNYDCDGIILDRIRYPQTSWTRTNKDFGYHPTAISNFHAQYGGSGIPDPYDSDWIEFRQDMISDTVNLINQTIKSIDSSHILYAYPIGRYNDAVNFNYQNWPDWLNNGYADGVFPQIYTSSNSTFSSRCDENRNAYSGSRLLGVATMAYTSGIDVAGQIRIARDKGFEGITPYRHGSMESLGYFDDLKEVFGIVVDNAEPEFSASSNWWTSTWSSEKFEDSYRVRACEAASDAATWIADLPSSGNWEVYAWWTGGYNRAYSAPYIVYHSGGYNVIGVDQRYNGGQWNYLGTWNMNSGTNYVKLSCWTSSGDYVIADAVKWVKAD